MLTSSASLARDNEHAKYYLNRIKNPTVYWYRKNRLYEFLLQRAIFEGNRYLSMDSLHNIHLLILAAIILGLKTIYPLE